MSINFAVNFRVFKLQKRAARVVLGVNMKTRTVVNFTKLNWMPLFDEIKIIVNVL